MLGRFYEGFRVTGKRVLHIVVGFGTISIYIVNKVQAYSNLNR